MQAHKDENSINFNFYKNKVFEDAKQPIEERMNASNMDELEKLAGLKDKVLLTKMSLIPRKTIARIVNFGFTGLYLIF